jgi:serine/threonine-protein kinase
MEANPKNLPWSALGQYDLLGLLGSGSFGAVYRALDQKLQRPTAIKVLPQHLALDDKLVARFEREAQAAARLTHPNIVCIYTVGHSNGVNFIAMEHVEGSTLRDILEKGGRLPRQRQLGMDMAAIRRAHV